MKSAHDVGRSNLVEQIYDSTIDHDLWPATLDRIGQLAGGEITMLFVFDLRKRIIHRQLSTAFPALDEYISYYSLIDPRNEFGLAQPQGATFVDASFITPAGRPSGRRRVPSGPRFSPASSRSAFAFSGSYSA